VLACRPLDVLNNLLSWFLRCSGLLSHLRSCERYDEPETLPYSIHPVCPMSPDGGQSTRTSTDSRDRRGSGRCGRHPTRRSRQCNQSLSIPEPRPVRLNLRGITLLINRVLSIQ
jgi:hypothetical protein